MLVDMEHSRVDGKINDDAHLMGQTVRASIVRQFVVEPDHPDLLRWPGVNSASFASLANPLRGMAENDFSPGSAPFSSSGGTTDQGRHAINDGLCIVRRDPERSMKSRRRWRRLRRSAVNSMIDGSNVLTRITGSGKVRAER